jgi:AcrR family transcriptional regulator
MEAGRRSLHSKMGAMPGSKEVTDGGLDRPSKAQSRRKQRERTDETRDRIISAGLEILHHESIGDWKQLTVRGVAERARVNERTIYRYFGNERGLRDALLQRTEQEAGIDLNGLQLGNVSDAAAKILDHVSQYPRDPGPPLVPTLVAAKERQQQALLHAVAEVASDWPTDLQQMAAAMLDVQWSVAAYERLIENWQFDHDQALRGISWVLELIDAAVRDGRAQTSQPYVPVQRSSGTRASNKGQTSKAMERT